MPIMIIPWAGGYNSSSSNIDIIRRLDAIEKILQDNGFIETEEEAVTEMINDVFAGNAGEHYDDPEYDGLLENIFAGNAGEHYDDPDFDGLMNDVFP